ncbi:MAG: dihydroorotase [Rhodospirillaceae bacterium]|jgi:dihydroorotase|nr:dihydroorotase [Rhodospirillaceae bacterium]
MTPPPSAPAKPPRRQDRPLALVNARIVDPASNRDEPGGVLVDNGIIQEIGARVTRASAPENAEILDCRGQVLAPGLIDMRVQLREPGEEHKETIATASLAAAAGGVTSMVCLPNTEPIIDDVAGVEFIARRARETKRAKIYCYGALTQGLEGKDLVEMALLADSGALGFTDGIKATGDVQVMRRALTYARSFDLLVIQHPEDPRLAAGGAMNNGELSTRLGLPGIPAYAEVMMIERDLHLVRGSGARYHAAHISTAAAVEAIRKAKQEGLRVTCDTAPPYFSLNENEIGDYRTFAKLSPPLRGESDRRAIAAGLADGVIDCIASDHAPHDVESKRVPFAQAEAGIVGLETLLPISLEPHHKGAMSLLAALRCLTARPADILGLPQGRLSKGAPADMVLIDLDRPHKIDVAKFRSKSKNSPYDGRPVQGCVLKTFVDGRLVYSLEGER